MSDNIKIREKDKQAFDMLQAEFTLKTGKKVTQQELFSKIIEFTKSKKDSFFGRLLELPLSDKDIEKLKSIQSDWGAATKEGDIDRVLYGAKA